MPDWLEGKGGNWRLEHLPASYANFPITNGAVIVPIFGQPENDDGALVCSANASPAERSKGSTSGILCMKAERCNV